MTFVSSYSSDFRKIKMIYHISKKEKKTSCFVGSFFLFLIIILFSIKETSDSNAKTMKKNIHRIR